MKPILLKRHLETINIDKNDRDASYVQGLGEKVKRQRLDKTGRIYQRQSVDANVSSEVSILVAKNVNAHMIAVSRNSIGKVLV